MPLDARHGDFCVHLARQPIARSRRWCVSGAFPFSAPMRRGSPVTSAPSNTSEPGEVAVSQTMATSPVTGSARVQGDLWGVRSRDYAEIQEPTFLPLYKSASSR